MADTKTKTAPAPRSGWWWFAAILTGLFVLIATITTGVVVTNENARVNRNAVADSAGPRLQVMHPGVATAVTLDGNEKLPPLPDEDLLDALRDFFEKFGRAVKTPGETLDDFFEMDALSDTGLPENAPEIDQQIKPRDPLRFVRETLKSERRTWRNWDWDRGQIRKANATPDGRAYEAIFAVPNGTPIRWTLNRSPGGWEIRNWENLRSGITGRDSIRARSFGELGSNSKARGQYQFNELARLHAEIEAGQLKEARTRLERLQRVRWEKELQYAVDLAECRLALAEPADYDDYENEIGPTALRELIEREPSRLAAYYYLAKSHLDFEKYPEAIEAAGAYLSVAGDDADALAIRGEAAYAMVLNDTARADFDKVLALDPANARAMNWKRKILPADRKGEAFKPLAKSARARDDFTWLAARCRRDKDWAGLMTLAETVRVQHPAFAPAFSSQIAALIQLKKTDEAIERFKSDLEKYPESSRAQLVREFVDEMILTEKIAGLYEAIPKAYGPVAFRQLAQLWYPHEYRFSDEKDPKARETKKAEAAKKFAELLREHRERHPGDVWPAYYEGLQNSRAGKFREADKQYTVALTKLVRTGDWSRDYESGYEPVLNELIPVRCKLGKAVETYRELASTPGMFERIANLLKNEADVAELEKLIAERYRNDSADIGKNYWSAEVAWYRKDYAAAAKSYSRYLDDPQIRALEYSQHWDAAPNRIRALLRSDAFAEAQIALDELEYPMPALGFAIAIRSGRKVETEQALRDLVPELPHRPNLFVPYYRDEDLGPLLRGKGFENFRRDFPPPSEVEE